MRSFIITLFFALLAIAAAQLRVRDLAELADVADPDETQFKPVVRARFLSSTPKSSKKSKTGDSKSKSSKKSSGGSPSSPSAPSAPSAPTPTTPSTVSSPSTPTTPTSSRRW